MIFEKKILCQHAFKTGLATSIASALYLYFKIPNGYWMVIISALIMQSDLEVAGFYCALRQGVARLLGTLIGVAIGLLSLFVVRSNMWLGVPMVFIIMYVSTFIIERHFGLKMVGATAIIIMLISAHYQEPWTLALYRCCAIFIGCFIAIAVSAFVFPYPADIILSQSLAKLLGLQADVFQLLMKRYTDQKVPDPTIKFQIRSWQKHIEKNDRVMQEMRRSDVSQKKHYVHFVENTRLLAIHIRRMYDAECYYDQKNMYFSSVQPIFSAVSQVIYQLFNDVSMGLRNNEFIVDCQLAQSLIDQFDEAINQLRVSRLSVQKQIGGLEESYHLLAFFHSIEGVSNLLFELCDNPLLRSR